MVAFSIPLGRELLAAHVAIGIFCIIRLALRSKGPWVPAVTSVFIVAVVAQRLLMKQLFSPPFEYRFAAVVTTLHFMSVWVVCWLYFIVSTGDLSKCMPKSLGSVRRYIVYIVPISCSVPLSVVLNNQALLFMGAGLNGIFSTLTPLTTALVSHMLGRRIAKAGWGALFIAFTGAVIIGSGKFRTNSASKSPLLGMSFALVAMGLRSVKVVLQDRILAPSAYAGKEKEEKGCSATPSTPMHVWALQAPACTLVSLAVAVCSEDLTGAWHQLTPSTGGMILLTCVTATAVNLLGLHNTKNLGATLGQVVGQLNTVLLVTFSVAFYDETFSSQVVVGTALLFAGVSAYQLAEGGGGQVLAATLLKQRDNLAAIIRRTPRPTAKTAAEADGSEADATLLRKGVRSSVAFAV
jgi:drug/metabolite transporter (DMT)-like permease